MLIRTFKTTLLATGILAAVIGGNADKAIAQSREMWLYTGGQSMVEGTFYAGESIYGWCDQDCYDLDLMLYDTNNNLLSQDVATDAQPVVVAPYAGQFRIMVTMPNCNHQAGCAAWVDSDAHFSAVPPSNSRPTTNSPNSNPVVTAIGTVIDTILSPRPSAPSPSPIATRTPYPRPTSNSRPLPPPSPTPIPTAPRPNPMPYPVSRAASREMWLYTGGQSMVEGTFYAGESIYGWCDQDCYDLDLMLYDTNNNLLSQDVATDAQPVVVAPYAGQFRIMVTMPNCNHQAGCAAWVDSDAHF